MKFLLLTNGFPPPFVGGSGRYMYNVFKRFPAGEVTIFTEVSRDPNPRDQTTGPRFIRRSYIKPGVPRSATRLEKLRMMLLWPFELVCMYWRDRPDCIYIGQIYLVGLLGLLLKHLLGIPYIVLAYGEEFTTLEASGLRRALFEAVCRNAHALVAISNFTMSQAIAIGVNEDRIALVPPGVDADQFQPNIETADLQARLGLTGCKVVLTVGRLTKRKGHAQVISALPQVAEMVPNVRYLIVGEDVGEAESLRNLAKRLGVAKQVIFVGRVRSEDLPMYYNLCDVFVMANYEESDQDTEGFGIVFLEANACGKPAIGGRAGGVPDAVADGETGLLVDATDIEALSRAMIKLLTDEAYAQRLGANGHRRVIKGFSWDKAAFTIRELGLAAKKGSL